MQVGILYKIINFFLDARLKLGIITFCSVTGMVLPFQARFPRKFSSDFFVFGKISHSDAGEQVQKLAFCDLTCFGPHGIIFLYFIQPLMTDGSVEHHTE